MLIHGLDEIPIAIHYMDEGIDTGDVIVSDTIMVERDDDYNSVMHKITAIEDQLLFSAIKQIESDTVYHQKQNKNRLGYITKRTPADSKIDWSKNSNSLHNFVRALVDPMPNAFAFLESGHKVLFKESYRGTDTGQVLAEIEDNKYIISTIDGIIFIKTDKKLKVGDKFDIE